MTNRHILIVDDEPRVAFFLSKALEHADQDYRVSVAHSGEEALETINRTPVDLLVTDLRMPGINGLQLMRWVRASSPQTRTILITAYGNDEVETEAHRLEAYRYITKPFSLDAFTQVAQEALRDMAVSQPGVVVLSGESYEAITKELENLCRDVGAQCVFLADMLGQRLVEVGITEGIDSAALLSLLAGGFAATSELARHFGSGEAANLNFHQGSRYEVYSANIGDNLFAAMLYKRETQSSRIGLVWLYTRRVITRLLDILSNNNASVPAQPLDADFGSSLMTELDTLLTDSSPQAEPVHHYEPPPQRDFASAERSAQEEIAEAEALLSETLGVPLLNEHKREQGQGLLSMDDAIAQGLISPDLGGD